MAVDTLQYEKKIVEDAQKELDKALGDFDERIKEYEKFGKELLRDLQEYHERRRFFLE